MTDERRAFGREIDYGSDVAQHSDIIYRYLYPQNSSVVTLTSGGVSGPTSIVVPPACTNFGRSSLNFQLVLQGQGSGTYTFVNANTTTIINRIRLFDQFSNSIWLDLSSVNQVMSMLVPSCTKIETFLTKSFYTGELGSTASLSALYAVEDISRFMDIPAFTSATASAGGTQAGGAIPFATYTAPTNYVGSGTNSSLDLFGFNPYTARKQFYIDTAAAATSSSNYLDVNIPLDAFKLTVLSYDKLLWNASNLQMDIWWNPLDAFAFSSQSKTDPSSTPKSLTYATSACQIQNIALVLANENNLQIVAKVIENITQSGLRVEIPWPTATKNTISSQGSHSYQIALSTAYGNSLLAIITAPFQPTNSGSSAPYANTHQRGNLSTYNTFINNISIANPSYYNVLNTQDYMVGNRKFLRGSTVQTLGEYVQSEWIHVDSWFGTKPLYSLTGEEIDGLDLRRQNSVFQWQSTLSTATSYTWLSLLVGQKTLQLSSQGSMVY